MLHGHVPDVQRNGVREDACCPRRCRTSFSVSTASNEGLSNTKPRHTFVGAADVSTDLTVWRCMVDTGVGTSLPILFITQLACVSRNSQCNTASTGCLAAVWFEAL